MFLVLGLLSIRTRLIVAPWLDKLVALGPVFYAVPLAVFSAEHLVGPRIMQVLVPRWIPWHLFWVYFVGFCLLSAAVSILINRYAGLAGLLLGMMFFLFVALLDLPGTPTKFGNRLFWAYTFRELAFGGAAWALAASRAPEWRYSRFLMRTGRLLVALATLLFATQFVLHPVTAPGVPLELITPPWVPWAPLWGLLTGTVLLVAGLAILLDRTRRLAAALAGLAVTLPVLLLYLPLLILARQPSEINDATNNLFDTLLYAGTLLLVADED